MVNEQIPSSCHSDYVNIRSYSGKIILFGTCQRVGLPTICILQVQYDIISLQHTFVFYTFIHCKKLKRFSNVL